MPTSEAPTDLNEPNRPPETNPKGTSEESSTPASAEEPRPAESESPVVRGSRWIDYDTHELLQMSTELEDDRRWARLREGIWIAILLHLALISALTWIPRYVFKVPQVIDPIEAIKNRKDLQYLDLPPDALRNLHPKVVVKPVPEKPTVIDKQTLEAMKRVSPPPAPEPASQPPAPAPAPPQPSQPIPANQQSQLEAPRPAAVPARPNFAMGSQNPADQLRDAMKGSARNPGSFGSHPPSIQLPQHPGAKPGVDILSDTQGVDFSAWMRRMYVETMRTWDPLIPDEVNPPINKSGIVLIRFKVLPSGRLMDGSMVLEGRSGDVALDRAAWGALTGSNYPPLPRDFHGPYLELRASFWYNLEPK